MEHWIRRQLSTRPRLRSLAAVARRLLVPSRWRARASQHWDSQVGEVEAGHQRGWLDWPILEEEYVRPWISGDSEEGYLPYLFKRHLDELPASRVLSLGCGGGNLERAMIDLRLAERIDAFDVSPESIRLAAELAASAGMAERIRYAVADLDHLELPPGTYDVVIAKMALHHLENLERVYRQIRQSLLPGGIFMFNEFVGPSRFQWTNLQLELMNELLEALPERQRRAAPFKRVVRPDLEDMKTLDPSESVRSEEIVPLLAECFDVVDHRPYGGTLLHILLSHVMASFDLEDAKDLSILRLMFLHERTLIRQGVLPSDFACVVARPRVGRIDACNDSRRSSSS